MMEGKDSRKSRWMFISSMLIFGTIGIFRRYIPLSSGFLAFSRGLLGGLFLLVLTGTGKRKLSGKMTRNSLLQLIISGAFIGVNWILLFEAYHYTTVAVATLCYYMQPTIVILLSPLVFRERMTWKKAGCAAVSLLGMTLVSGVAGDSSAQGGSMQGILLGLGAAAFYSAVVMMNRKIRGVDAYQRTIIQLLSAGMVMLPYLLLTNGFTSEGFSVSALLLLAVVGILHTGVAYALYFGGMEGLSLQSVAVLSYIDPVSALLFSAFLLGEPLSVTGIIGAVMILGAALVSEIRPGEAETAPAERNESSFSK